MSVQTAQTALPPPAAGHVRSWPGAGLARGWPGVAVISFLATILSWRPYPWHPVYAGIDPSWEVGLAMGFMRHLQWGPSVIFTFGPYGFVDGIFPFYHLTAFLSVLYALAIVWGLAALLVSALRPSWSLLGAGVVTWAALTIAASYTGYSDVAAATALGLALAVLAGGADRTRLTLLGLLGALAGFQLMVKTNDGLLTIGILVVVVALGEIPRKWATVVAGVPLVAVFLLGWLAAGQSVTNIASYVRGSVSVAVGYSSAMQVTAGRSAEDWYALLVSALVVLLFALSVKGRPGRYQAAVMLILAGWLWAALKEGFVRHDDHDLTFFGLALAAVLLARLKRRYVPLQAGVFAVTAVVFCLAAGTVPGQLHAPVATTSAFFKDVGEVLGGGGLGRAQQADRGQFVTSGDALSPATLSLLEGHSVAVEPVENSIVYAYPQLNWDPEPVLQAYSAYTSYLDRLDAAFLASARAPERILYQPWMVIDGRDTFLDPPATVESLYCHYVQLPAPGPAQVLAHVANRCGQPVEVRRASAPFGVAVAVPSRPGEMVTATFSFGAPLRARLEGVLLKPPTVSLTTWIGRPQPLTYRFIAGTAADDHVLSVPKSLGYSADFTPAPVQQVALAGGGWGAGKGEYTVTFYAVPLGVPQSAPGRLGGPHASAFKG
jgi:hypothetical protein